MRGLLPSGELVAPGSHGPDGAAIDHMPGAGVAARLAVNDTTLIADVARSALGSASMPDVEIEGDLASASLQRVRENDVPPTSRLFLYFPARIQSRPKLRAVIDTALAFSLPASSGNA
jgi:DNA-binding transcriptional LysR family regulator